MSVLPFWDNPTSPLGERLKKAIVDAGLDEKTIVARGIVSRQQLTSMLHGSLDNVKGGAFKRMANQGIDLQYIFTGVEAPQPQPQPKLKADEAALIDNYRNTSPERQGSLREVGSAFAEPKLDIAADGIYADPKVGRTGK